VLVTVQLLIAIALLVVGSQLFVTALDQTASALQIPQLVLALVIVPVATELPETLNSVLWVRTNDDMLASANVAGSAAFQACILAAIGIVFTTWQPGRRDSSAPRSRCSPRSSSLHCSGAVRREVRCSPWRLCRGLSTWWHRSRPVDVLLSERGRNRTVIQVHTTGDVEEYAAAAETFLKADPCARNVLLTIIDIVRAAPGTYSGAPSFWWITDGGAVVGAANWTPPHNLLVSALPPTTAPQLADAAVKRAASLGLRPPGVAGPAESARAVAAAWTAITGDIIERDRTILLNELGALVEVPMPTGARRAGRADDVPLIARWLQTFSVEIEHPVPANARAIADHMVARRADGCLDRRWSDRLHGRFPKRRRGGAHRARLHTSRAIATMDMRGVSPTR